MLTGVKCTVAVPPRGIGSPHWQGMDVMWEQEAVVSVWAGVWSLVVLVILVRVVSIVAHTCSQDFLQLWESRQEEFID